MCELWELSTHSYCAVFLFLGNSLSAQLGFPSKVLSFAHSQSPSGALHGEAQTQPLLVNAFLVLGPALGRLVPQTPCPPRALPPPDHMPGSHISDCALTCIKRCFSCQLMLFVFISSYFFDICTSCSCFNLSGIEYKLIFISPIPI